METKSRYEVISELESKKRELIRERDEMNDKVLAQEQTIKNTEETKDIQTNRFARNLEDLEKEIKNYDRTFSRRKEDLEREKEDTIDSFNKKKEKVLRDMTDNTKNFEITIERNKESLDNFKKTMEDRKKTITELIKSIDDNLERFGKIQFQKKE